MKVRTAFIADTRSMYFGVRNKFPGYTMNYLDLIKKLEDDHNMIFTFKFAFGKYEADKCYKFNTLLRETGFEVQFDRKYYDTALALKAATVIPHVDAIVVASCWYDHFGVLEYAKKLGKLPYLVGVDNPRFAGQFSAMLEIDNTLLRKKDEITPPAE